MSSNLKVNTILPSTGTSIGIGTAGGNTTISGAGTFLSDVSVAGDFQVPDVIKHAGDVNTKIRFPAADTVSIETAGSERLRIDSTGRVLIGTTSADSVGSIDQNVVIGSTTNAEEVALTLNVMEGTNNRRVKFFLDDDDGEFGLDSTASTGVSPFVVRMAASEKLRIDTSGRVLIGTQSTSDNAFLVVKGNVTGSNQQGELLLLNGATIEANYGLGQISFGGDTGDQISSKIQGFADADWNTGGDATDSPGRLGFFTTADGESSPTERLRITSAGIIETYGGSGGAAVRIKNGGDAEFYAANNSSKVTLHCDTNLQLTIGDKLRFANTSGGILRSNGQHALKPTGACIQTKVTYRGTKFTNSSGSYQVVHSHDFNGIESGNRIGMHLDCDMNADNSPSSWQMMGLRIGSTMYSEKIIEHSAGMNMNASANGLTGAMSAGNHAVQFITRNGGGQCSYNEGNTATGIVLHTYEYVS